mgnify:CR=1 FL=1
MPQHDNQTYQQLKRAILQFAEDGVTHGVIRTTNYTGDVEADLSRAAYSVAREDPVGAYTIDFLTHDCSLIVSYYEITIDITFRDMAEDPRTLEYVTNQKEVETLLREDARNEAITEFLPFRYFTYEPLAIYLGKTPVSEIPRVLLIQAFWLVALYAVERILWRRACKKVLVQGG